MISSCAVSYTHLDVYKRQRLNVLKGDLSTLDQPGTRNIAAVYSTDDYDNPVMDSHWAKIGDTVTLRYGEEFEFYDPFTGEVLDPENIPDDQPYRTRAVKYRDIDYTVTALVDVPYPLSYRYYGSDEFILNDQTFIQDLSLIHILSTAPSFPALVHTCRKSQVVRFSAPAVWISSSRFCAVLSICTPM